MFYKFCIHMSLQDNVYDEIYSVILRQYNSEHGIIKGNGISKNTVTGQALKNKDVLELEHIDKKLNIDHPSEASNIDLEMYKTVVQYYHNKLKHSIETLNEHNKGIAYEVVKLQERLSRLEDKINAEIYSPNQDSTGHQDLLNG